MFAPGLDESGCRCETLIVDAYGAGVEAADYGVPFDLVGGHGGYAAGGGDGVREERGGVGGDEGDFLRGPLAFVRAYLCYRETREEEKT